MVRLNRAPNILIAQHWLNLLHQAGIACKLHNQYVQGAMGEIPVDQCGPEIWLERESDLALARRIIDEPDRQAGISSAHWSCPVCTEWLEPQFTVCWQCGTTRPTHR